MKNLVLKLKHTFKTAILLVFLMSLSSLAVKAQEARTVENVDSLRTLLKQAKTGPEKADLNLKMCQALVEKDSIGSSYCLAALDIYGSNAKEEDRSDKIYLLLSAYQTVKGKYDSAMALARKALLLARNGNNLKLQPEVLLSIGNNYARRSIFDSAYYAYMQALHLYDSLGKRSSSIYLSLANTNTRSKGDLDLSLQYLKEAESISIEEGSSDKLGRIYYNIAVVFIRKQAGETIASLQDSAMSYLGKSANFYARQESKNHRMIGVNYRLMGSILMQEGKYDSAEYNLRRALEHLSRINYEWGMGEVYDYLGTIKLKQGKLEEAKSWVGKAMASHKQIGAVDRMRHSLITMHEINIEEGDFEAALANFTRRVEMKDSIYSIESKMRTEALQVKHKTELQEAENRILKKETELKTQTIQTQYSIVVASIIVVLVVLAAASLLWRQSRSRKKLLDHIASQAAKLKTLDQAKSRFFANISHDLRSPLTLILNAFDQVTSNDYEVLENKSKTALDAGYKNSKRLLHLADEIMELTRLEDGKISPKPRVIKIIPYTKLLAKMFNSAMDLKGIKLSFGFEPVNEDVSTHIDPSHFERIIYNILSNAMKFTPKHGKIDIGISSLGEKNILIAISDTGPGIPQEQVSYIFDRYYQASDEYTSQAGVGIGLALVKELVELNKGSISVDSSESGTTFTIQLPVVAENSDDLLSTPDVSMDMITKNSLWSDLQEENVGIQVPALSNPDQDAPTLLIVEDHVELRSYIKSLLSDTYRICLASNGQEALKTLEQHKIDLIISDLMMPYMDGFELIERLKTDKTLKKLPVLVLSARTDQSEKLGLLSKGAEIIINKPFDKEELLLNIKNLLTRKSEWNAEMKFTRIYESNNTNEYEKNILFQLEQVVVDRIDDSNLSVIDLADKIAASESKAYRMLKKMTGLSPSEYIKEIRLQYVHEYIKNHGVETVIEVARKIGINNATYFNKIYQERFGESVKELIRQ